MPYNLKIFCCFFVIDFLNFFLDPELAFTYSRTTFKIPTNYQKNNNNGRANRLIDFCIKPNNLWRTWLFVTIMTWLQHHKSCYLCKQKTQTISWSTSMIAALEVNLDWCLISLIKLISMLWHVCSKEDFAPCTS